MGMRIEYGNVSVLFFPLTLCAGQGMIGPHKFSVMED